MPSTQTLFTAAAICFLVALAVPTAAITVGEDPASDDVTLTPIDDRYATIENGELTLDVNVYDHAKTTILDVFTIQVGAEATNLEAIWIDHDVDGVAFYADGTEVTPDSQLHPAPGETVTVGLQVETPDAISDNQTFSVNAAYADDEDDEDDEESGGSSTTGGDIRPAEIDYSATDLEAGETLRVNATYWNDGDSSDVKMIELIVDGVVVDRQSIHLEPGEEKTVTFERTMDLTGTFEVHTTDRKPQSITVWPPGEPAPAFAITDAAVEPESIEPGESAQITATIENTGNATGSMSAELVVGSVVVDTMLVELDAGDSTTVTFERQFDSPGAYELSISGADAGTVTVGSGMLNRSFPSSSAAAAAPAVALGLLFAITGLRRQKSL